MLGPAQSMRHASLTATPWSLHCAPQHARSQATDGPGVPPTWRPTRRTPGEHTEAPQMAESRQPFLPPLLGEREPRT